MTQIHMKNGDLILCGHALHPTIIFSHQRFILLYTGVGLIIAI